MAQASNAIPVCWTIRCYIAEAVADYGMTPERLQTAWERLEAVQNGRRVQRQLQGANRQALREGHAALQMLHKWMTAFVGIARVDMQDQLMTLGLVAPTRRRYEEESSAIYVPITIG